MAQLTAGALRPASPCAIVIFGAARDLTKRTLVPARSNLKANGLLPREVGIVGVGRKPMSHEQFRQKQTADVHEFATRLIEQDGRRWRDLA